MNGRIVYSEGLFTKQTAKHARKYRITGLFSLAFVIVMTILDKSGLKIKDQIPMAFGNLLAVLVFASLCSWILHSLFLLSKWQQAKESYISSNGCDLIYHVLKSRDTIGRIREVYHSWHIRDIEKVIEATNYFIIYGDIERTETINKGSHTKNMNVVKTPKYYDGLSNLLVHLKA